MKQNTYVVGDELVFDAPILADIYGLSRRLQRATVTAVLSFINACELSFNDGAIKITMSFKYIEMLAKKLTPLEILAEQSDE